MCGREAVMRAAAGRGVYAAYGRVSIHAGRIGAGYGGFMFLYLRGLECVRACIRYGRGVWLGGLW